MPRRAGHTYGAGPREKKRVGPCQVSPVWWTRARRDSRNACDVLLKISIEKFSVESGQSCLGIWGDPCPPNLPRLAGAGEQDNARVREDVRPHELRTYTSAAGVTGRLFNELASYPRSDAQDARLRKARRRSRPSRLLRIGKSWKGFPIAARLAAPDASGSGRRLGRSICRVAIKLPEPRRSTLKSKGSSLTSF